MTHYLILVASILLQVPSIKFCVETSSIYVATRCTGELGGSRWGAAQACGTVGAVGCDGVQVVQGVFLSQTPSTISQPVVPESPAETYGHGPLRSFSVHLPLRQRHMMWQRYTVQHRRLKHTLEREIAPPRGHVSRPPFEQHRLFSTCCRHMPTLALLPAGRHKPNGVLYSVVKSVAVPVPMPVVRDMPRAVQI